MSAAVVTLVVAAVVIGALEVVKRSHEPRHRARRVEFVKVRRMCGGGVRWDIRADGSYGRRWNVLTTRRVPGAIIFDWFGVAVAWRGDWS